MEEHRLETIAKTFEGYKLKIEKNGLRVLWSKLSIFQFGHFFWQPYFYKEELASFLSMLGSLQDALKFLLVSCAHVV